MTKTALGNKNLLILGGLAAIAALLYFKGSGTGFTGAGGGAGGYQGLTGGGSGDGSPTIYNLPGEGTVNFPQAGGLTLEDLMKLLTPAPPGDPQQAGTKKDFMTNPVYVNPDGTPKLFIQAPPPAPVAEATPPTVWDPVINAAVGGLSLMGLSNPLTAPFALVPLAQLLAGKKEVIPSSFGGNAIWSASGVSTGGADTKKGLASTDQGVFNLSNTSWDKGLGMSTDSVTGQLVPWQRDIAIYQGYDILYNPTTKAGNPMEKIDQNLGRFGTGNPLAPPELALTMGRYETQGWFTSSTGIVGNTTSTQSAKPASGTGTGGGTKKEASASSSTFGGSGGFGGGGAGGR